MEARRFKLYLLPYLLLTFFININFVHASPNQTASFCMIALLPLKSGDLVNFSYRYSSDQERAIHASSVFVKATNTGVEFTDREVPYSSMVGSLTVIQPGSFVKYSYTLPNIDGGFERLTNGASVYQKATEYGYDFGNGFVPYSKIIGRLTPIQPGSLVSFTTIEPDGNLRKYEDIFVKAENGKIYFRDVIFDENKSFIDLDLIQN